MQNFGIDKWQRQNQELLTVLARQIFKTSTSTIPFLNQSFHGGKVVVYDNEVLDFLATLVCQTW